MYFASDLGIRKLILLAFYTHFDGKFVVSCLTLRCNISQLTPKLYMLQENLNMENDKKAVRATVKHAIDLRNQQKISEDVLRSLVELAMAYEITTGLEEKIDSKTKILVKLR